MLCSGYNIATATSTVNAAQNTGLYNFNKVQVGGRSNVYEIECGFHDYTSGGVATNVSLVNVHTMEDCVNACSDYATNGSYACVGINYNPTGLSGGIPCGMYSGDGTGNMGSPNFDTAISVARMLNAPSFPNAYTAVTDPQYLLPTSSAVYNLGLCASATAYAKAVVLPQNPFSPYHYNNYRFTIECGGVGFASTSAQQAGFVPATIASTIGLSAIATADDCQRVCYACISTQSTNGCGGNHCYVWYWFNSNSTCLLASTSSSGKTSGNAWDIAGSNSQYFGDTPIGYKRDEVPGLPGPPEHVNYPRQGALGRDDSPAPPAVQSKERQAHQPKYAKRNYYASSREVILVD